jgi:hypothetical protein
MEKIITTEQAKEIIAQTKGAIFSTQFIKKDRTIRNMVCRLNVKKYLKGGKNNCAGYPQYVTVFEMKGEAAPIYRNINIDTMLTLKVGGNAYVIGHEVKI